METVRFNRPTRRDPFVTLPVLLAPIDLCFRNSRPWLLAHQSASSPSFSNFGISIGFFFTLTLLVPAELDSPSSAHHPGRMRSRLGYPPRVPSRLLPGAVLCPSRRNIRNVVLPARLVHRSGSDC